MRIKAYAKINLGLDVLGKRPDGYHDLWMVMLPITLHDLIDIKVSDKPGFIVHPNYRIRPEKNTILKMIEVCREEFHFTEQFFIHLTKHIPSQAGLGGGSSDAASVLNYLNNYFKWNLSETKKVELALKVGSDVPFCTFNRPAIVSKTGEEMSFFSQSLPFHILLVQAHKGVSTPKAFAHLNLNEIIHPDIMGIKDALENNDYTSLINSMANVLEVSAIELVPEIKSIKKQLVDLGLDKAVMTGSGSVVMGFSQNEECINKAFLALKGQYRFLVKTKVL
ncbi:MAG: 4-(cytidine 5'-diphospho)-2-C-methyl-D-erythritol kinase [Erysipelotrichaceae bacterium]